MDLLIPSLSSLTVALRDDFKDNSLLSWNPAHQQALDAIKNAISAETSLAFCNPIKGVIVQADASTTGLGATFLLDKKSIALARKTLSDIDLRCANIERELLAVVYG